jgi:hypothetical protein
MKPIAFLLALAVSSPAMAAQYRISVTQVAAASPVLLPGNCPGGVCPVPRTPAEARAAVGSAVRIVASCGSCRLAGIPFRIAAVVRDRQPVRSAVKRVLSRFFR